MTTGGYTPVYGDRVSGGRVLAVSRDQAWRYRDDWNRVLPVPGAELTVDRPWAGAEFERPAAPSLLLRAEFGIVGYSFRQAELRAAREWCRARSRFALSYVDAQGGAGKTRFGLELCKEMAGRGWVAGFLPKDSRGVADVPLARLVVVDYVEERETQVLAGQLSALERSATPLAPVRVLLLSRPAGGSLAGRVLEPLREQPTVSGYRRDLSISYNKLADLTRDAGRSAEAEGLYRQGLTVRQELTELEPGNTTYRRDLSVSYERLADLALEADEAMPLLMIALGLRRELHRQEPQRVDLAEELGVTLYLLAGTIDDPASALQEIIDTLSPFERTTTITRKGVSLLAWARQPPAK